MTTEPIIDDMNEAIALFMGYEKYEDNYGIWFKCEGLIKCLHPKLQSLEYHLSWDRLMEVWFKCQDIGADLGKAFEKVHNAFHAGIDLKDIGQCHKVVFQFIVYLKNKTDG